MAAIFRVVYAINTRLASDSAHAKACGAHFVERANWLKAPDEWLAI